MTRRSVITWKNAEVTVEKKDDDLIVLLFVNNICVGRSMIGLPIEPQPPKECTPWYAFRYGERAIPDRGGNHLRNWRLDMSPEAIERRERLGAQMRNEQAEHEKKLLERVKKKKQEHNEE